MSDQDTLALLTREIARIFVPLQRALSDFSDFYTFMLALGWNMDEIPPPLEELTEPIFILVDILEEVSEGEEVDPGRIVALQEAIVGLVEAIQRIETRPDEFSLYLREDSFAEEFPQQLLDYLIERYLRICHPAVGSLLTTLGLIEVGEMGRSGSRPEYTRRRIIWSDFPVLLENPERVFERAYGWGQVNFKALTIYSHVLFMLNALGISAHLSRLDPQLAPALEGETGLPADPFRMSVRIPLALAEEGGATTEIGFGLYGLAETDSLLPGLAFLPYGTGELDERLPVGEHLFLTVETRINLAGGVGIVLRPEQAVQLLTEIISSETGETPSSGGRLMIGLKYTDTAGEPTILIGGAEGSRLEIVGVSVSGGVADRGDDGFEALLELELVGGKLVITGTGDDGFLQSVFPGDGIEAGFDLVLGLSTLRGLYFRGSGGLELKIPTHVEVGGLNIKAITIGVIPTDGSIPVNLGASVQVKLGPLLATVENMGLTATFEFPGSGGNLGPLDLKGPGFKPPTSIGLSIDSSGFKGGGFLDFEPENDRYVGMLELEFQDQIAIKAVGLLTTSLPGGGEGFSLLIIITAEFTPIQIGFGFTLTGVGGLLGLNRTARVKRLRAGVKENTLNNILFPQNVVANADRIISDLRQVFPPQADRFIFGPMAQLGWGAQSLVTIELGLLIEVPDPVRVAILGVLQATLPDEEAELLKLQVNFLGVIDFEAKLLSFDASLFDSSLLAFTLAGDMAIRLSWGNNPNFLLSVGGFHPAYEPPPLDLPAMVRLSLQLNWGDVVRLRLETYFAVTSNTVQFGVRLEIWAGSGKFHVYGFLAFDVLFQFNPFRFVAQMKAMLALRAGSKSIASIKLSLMLEGPKPWHAKGIAKVKLLLITVKVRFNKTLGERIATSVEDVNLLPLLCEALSNQDNWAAQPPAGRHLSVSLTSIEVASDQTVVHPSGVLTISQKVAPLDIEIDKVGSQPLAGANRFTITAVRIGAEGDGLTLSPDDFDTVKEQFAPAQFFEMSDPEKLSRKSYEAYPAGVKITKLKKLDAAYAVKRAVAYELWYIDEQCNQYLFPWQNLLTLDPAAFNTWVVGGAVAASPLSFANNRTSALAPTAVQVNQEAFAVVKTKDLRPVNGHAMAASEVEAQELRRQMVREDANLEGELQVVPAFEVNPDS